MMLSPYKIRWQNVSSLDFNLWTELSFDGDNGDVETHLSREAIMTESYNGTFKRVYGYRWGETLTFSVTFIKKDYEEFTEQENRRVLKWLTSTPNASFVDIYRDDSEVIAWSALGNWVNVSQYKLANGRIAGYVADFESVTPWALSPLRTITKDVSDPSDNIITINLDTDEPQMAIYPRITIQQHSNNIIDIDHPMDVFLDHWVEGSVFYDGNKYYWVDADGVKDAYDTNSSGFETTSVSIRNVCDVGEFNSLVKNNIIDEMVVLDGANRVVSTSRPNGRIFGDDFSWNWIPLYEGTNNLSFIGNCTVTIEYRTPMKIGEF